MDNKFSYLLIPVALAVTGCASNPDLPLIFGASNTIGISIGGSVPEQGGDFTIGYRGQDFALVPVTVVQPDGAEQQIGSEVRGDKFQDSFSVLGQFEAKASQSSTGPKTGLGKFFATGVVAKKLSDGFAKRLGHGRTTVSGCTEGTQGGGTGQQQAKPVQAAGKQQQAQAPKTLQQQPARAEGETRYRSGALMVFAQYEALGFSLGAAASQQGGDLTLGWKDRNIAIVPVITRDGSGRADQIRGKVTNTDTTWPDPTDHDALSVLGQFQFKSEQGSGTVDVGLGKFFSTGTAAQRLGDGFKTRLCEEYKAVPAQ